jgi:hypothetical protein
VGGLKLSGNSMQKIEVLETARRKIDRVHSLVEQFGIAKKGEAGIISQISRAALEAVKVFMSAGYGTMADSCNQMIMLGKRGGTQATKLRTYREMVVAVKVAIDYNVKMIIEGEKKDHAAAAEAKANLAG